jgi:hypothetical protein
LLRLALHHKEYETIAQQTPPSDEPVIHYSTGKQMATLCQKWIFINMTLLWDTGAILTDKYQPKRTTHYLKSSKQAIIFYI